MSASLRRALDEVHPQMLRATFTVDPQKLGEDDRRRAVGQMFDAALDRARLTKKAAADAMGYTDQAVIGRWISGIERIQLDKCSFLGPRFMAEFAAALIEDCPGASVETVISLRRLSA